MKIYFSDFSADLWDKAIYGPDGSVHLLRNNLENECLKKIKDNNTLAYNRILKRKRIEFKMIMLIPKTFIMVIVVSVIVVFLNQDSSDKHGLSVFDEYILSAIEVSILVIGVMLIALFSFLSLLKKYKKTFE